MWNNCYKNKVVTSASQTSRLPHSHPHFLILWPASLSQWNKWDWELETRGVWGALMILWRRQWATVKKDQGLWGYSDPLCKCLAALDLWEGMRVSLCSNYILLIGNCNCGHIFFFLALESFLNESLTKWKQSGCVFEEFPLLKGCTCKMGVTSSKQTLNSVNKWLTQHCRAQLPVSCCG